MPVRNRIILMASRWKRALRHGIIFLPRWFLLEDEFPLSAASAATHASPRKRAMHAAHSTHLAAAAMQRLYTNACTPIMPGIARMA